MRTIYIGGKERPVYMNINALSDFNEGTRTNLEWIFKVISKPMEMSMNEVRWLVFAGLKHGAIESKINVDFDVNQVGRWLNDEFDKLPLFLQALAETMPFSDAKKK